MLGPVLYLEMLLGSRRGKQYVFRYIYAGWLLFLVTIVAAWYGIHLLAHGNELMPPFSDGFLSTLLVQHFFLLILATPAYVAGSVTDEKTQGTLQYLMTADLTPAEIVLGKFLGRVAQVAMLAMVGVPVIAFCGVFGGLDPFRAFALICYSGFVLIAIGSASMLASVLTRTTREAVLSLYSVGIALIALYAVIDWLSDIFPVLQLPLAFMDTYVKGYLSPFYIPDHVWKISGLTELAKEMARAILVWGGFGAACLGISILLLRRAYIRQLEGEGKKKKQRWWRARRSAVKDDPIRWKEREVEGLAPFAFLRAIPTKLAVLGVFLLATASSGLIIQYNLGQQATLMSLCQSVVARDWNDVYRIVSNIDNQAAADAFRSQAMIVMFLASFIVAIRCSGAISGEREKHTWEPLLLSPMETRELIRGKLWGIINAARPYLLAYALPALGFAALAGIGTGDNNHGGPVLKPMAIFWTLSWLVTTWLAMYYVGAAGIWCSQRSKSSWRSLVGTLGLCYVGGFVLYGPVMVIVFILAYFVMLFILMVAMILQPGAANNIAGAFGWYMTAVYLTLNVALALLFLGLAWFFVHDTEKRVSSTERTRHWDYDPDRRRRYRSPARPPRAQPQYRD
jgi:ABC-type transport system involved in multi-copper enzyme maturation permease subunit